MRRIHLLLTPLVLACVGCAAVEEPTSLAVPPELATPVAAPPPSEARVLVPGTPNGGRSGRTVRPSTVDAVTVFPYVDGKIYPVAVSPGYLTTLLLEPGEQMPGKAAIGDPDPAHWLVEKTVAGSEKGPVVALLIKPGSEGISTNVFIPTNLSRARDAGRGKLRGARDSVRSDDAPS
jgi:conjugative transfer protein CagX